MRQPCRVPITAPAVATPSAALVAAEKSQQNSDIPNAANGANRGDTLPCSSAQCRSNRCRRRWRIPPAAASGRSLGVHACRARPRGIRSAVSHPWSRTRTGPGCTARSAAPRVRSGRTVQVSAMTSGVSRSVGSAAGLRHAGSARKTDQRQHHARPRRPQRARCPAI